MKSKEITGLSDLDLQDKLKEVKTELSRMKFNHALSPIENPLLIKNNRRLIARLNTELKKRRLQKA
ncbi:MAG: 50S ribosomal protein L29 [Luteibaculaceae bacterium]